MSVIFTRAPLRISASAAAAPTCRPTTSEHGGFLDRRRDRQVRLHAHPHGLPAPLPDEVLRDSRRSTTPRRSGTRSCARRCCRHWRGDPLEIASVADVPAGTGMGSSGAFTVCLLKALALAKRIVDHAGRAGRGRRARSRSTCSSEPVGKQDQYVSAHGGICAYTFNPDGSVDVEPLELAPRDAAPSCATTSCSSTPARRAARRRCSPTRSSAPSRGDDEMLANLHRTKEIGLPQPRPAARRRPRGLRRADARALGEQAPALARAWPTSASTRSTRSRGAAARSAASWSAPAAAASCSSTRSVPRTSARRWRRRERRSSPFDFEFQGCVGHRVRMSAPLRVGDRRLRADRPQAGRGARRRRRSSARYDVVAGGGASASRPTTAGEACADARGAARARAPTSSSSRRRHDQLADLAERGAGGGCARAGREAGRRSASRRSSAVAAAAERSGAARQGRLQPPLPPGHRARGRGGPLGRARRASCTCAAATATAAAPGYDREWRAQPERSGGGELIDQGMHLLDLTPLARSARCRCTRRCCARSSGTRRSRTTRRCSSASATRAPRRGRCCTSAGPSGRTCSRSRSTAAPPSSRSTAWCAPTARRRCAIYRMKPELGPPDVEEIDYPREDPSWAAEWEHFAAAIAGGVAAARRPRRRPLRLGRSSRTPTRQAVRAACASEVRPMARRVLVTGGSMGIGLACRPDAGRARLRELVLVARGAEALAGGGRGARRRGPRVARARRRRRAAWRRRAALDELDGLVCAAGVLGPDRPARRVRPGRRSANAARSTCSARCWPCITACRPCAPRGGADRDLLRRRRDRPAAALRRLRGLEGRGRAPDARTSRALARACASTRRPGLRRHAHARRDARGRARRRRAPSTSSARVATSKSGGVPAERAAELVAFLLSDDAARHHRQADLGAVGPVARAGVPGPARRRAATSRRCGASTSQFFDGVRGDALTSSTAPGIDAVPGSTRLAIDGAAGPFLAYAQRRSTSTGPTSSRSCTRSPAATTSSTSGRAGASLEPCVGDRAGRRRSSSTSAARPATCWRTCGATQPEPRR